MLRRAGIPALPAFSLMEVLVALGILGVGLVAVASLFPTALVLQKQATEEALRQQYTRSADAVLIGKGLSATVLYNYTEHYLNDDGDTATNPAFDVYPVFAVDVKPWGDNPPDDSNLEPPGPKLFYDETYNDTDSLLRQWSYVDRSFPSIVPLPSKREIYWVPLFRRGPEASLYINDWRIYVFVMQRQPDAEYSNDDPAMTNAKSDGRACANPMDPEYFPKVFREEVASVNGNVIGIANLFDGSMGTDNDAPEVIRAGDMVLGDNGLIFRVIAADGNSITVSDEAQYNPTNERELRAVWYARPPAAGEPSPIRDIRVLSNNVTRLKEW